MKALRKRMIEDMKIRNLSENTQKSYVYHVAKFAKYFGRSPDLLGAEEVREYQVHLIEERHLSASTLNVTVCALRFLYRVTLRRQGVVERIYYAKSEKRLPVVLSPDEVAQFFQSIKSLKYFALLLIPYAAGLRISEACRLKVADIDSQRMIIRIEQGKGRKDRNVMLSPRLLKVLREYWTTSRPSHWLFPGKYSGTPVSPASARGVCHQIALASGLKKRVTPHTLRHCFATHLLESGTEIRTIQTLLGHQSLASTQRYTRIATTTVRQTDSPLDSVIGDRLWLS